MVLPLLPSPLSLHRSPPGEGTVRRQQARRRAISRNQTRWLPGLGLPASWTEKINVSYWSHTICDISSRFTYLFSPGFRTQMPRRANTQERMRAPWERCPGDLVTLCQIPHIFRRSQKFKFVKVSTNFKRF